MIRHIVNLIPQRIREGYERFVEEMRNNLQGWRGPSLFFSQKDNRFFKRKRTDAKFQLQSIINQSEFS